MKTKFLVAIALVLGLGVNSADAQVRQRTHMQHQRIKQGVKSGELTKAETRNLVKDQRELHQDVKLAKSDGKITKGEKKILTKEANKDSREIYRKKHNNRDRN